MSIPRARESEHTNLENGSFDDNKTPFKKTVLTTLLIFKISYRPEILQLQLFSLLTVECCREKSPS